MYKTEMNNHPRKLNLAYYHQDGLLDIFIGFTAIMFSVGLLSGFAYMGGIAPALLYPVWMSARQKITIPRLGNMALTRQPAFWTQILVLTLTLLLGVFLFLAIGIHNWLQVEFPAWLTDLVNQQPFVISGIIAAGLMSLAGALMGIRRLFVYAGLIVVIFWAGQTQFLDLPIILLVTGVVIFCCGFIILTRFIQTHPIHKNS